MNTRRRTETGIRTDLIGTIVCVMICTVLLLAGEWAESEHFVYVASTLGVVSNVIPLIIDLVGLPRARHRSLPDRRSIPDAAETVSEG